MVATLEVFDSGRRKGFVTEGDGGWLWCSMAAAARGWWRLGVVLQFVHEMQQRAQKNFDASKDRSLPVFGVGVTFIDENGKERLKTLEDSVSDATGKEDLLLHLRMLALQKVASENGYNRLVLGLCTSRIACHVITATVKGSLKTLEFSNGPCSGINGLVSSFVKLLIPELNDSNVPLATRRRQKRFNLKPSESISSESFCPLCFSPLSKSDLLSLSSCQNYDILDAAACSSCRFQIFPKDPSSMEHFLSVLHFYHNHC
ncbi:hypothetical protein Q3G72_029410 [Acer saccharum]|nr:hypothetical protein Q3G72_029410 [Acer saccharum]